MNKLEASSKELTKSQKFRAFIYMYLSQHVKVNFSKMHLEWFKLIDKPQVAIAAPRGFAKSHIFSFFFPLFLLLEYPGIEIVLVSSSARIVERFMAKVKLELETNKKLTADYGFQKHKDKKWSHDWIELKNGSALQSIGADGKMRGMRPDMLIIDDIENDENVRSEEYRSKLKNRLQKSWMYTLKPTGQIFAVGTLLHPLSLLSEILEHDSKSGFSGFYTKKYGALADKDGNPDIKGTSVWENQWSTAQLYVERDRCIAAFEQERMNNPIPDALRKFSDQDIRYYTVLPPNVSYTMIIDPAVDTKHFNDYTAFVVIATDEDGIMYVVEAYHARLEPGEVIEKLFQLYDIYKPHTIGIEDVAVSKLYRKFFELESHRRGVYPNLQPMRLDMSRSGRSKLYRIEALSPFFRQGRIQLLQEHTDLRAELLSFPSGRHDDLIDALALQLTIMNPAKHQQQLLPKGCFQEWLNELHAAKHRKVRTHHSWVKARHQRLQKS